MTPSPSRRDISNFVERALVQSFCAALGARMARTAKQASQDLLIRNYVLSRIFEAYKKCAGELFWLADETSLEVTVQALTQLWDAAEMIPQSYRDESIRFLEEAHVLSAEHARRALKEARAGYPMSNGSLPRWLDLQRRPELAGS